ncbi:MAG: MFS transporter [Paracoccaceae bacterium]
MLPQIALSVMQLGVPVLAPVLVADLGLAPEAVGVLGGCIGFGSVWMFAANRAVTPVLGPRRSLMVACLLSVSGAALLLTGHMVAVLIGAVLIGFAYAITAPAGSQILSAHVPKEWWGTVFSIRQAGVPLGGAIAGIAGTAVALAFGWQMAVACLTVLPLLCVAILMAVPKIFDADRNGEMFRILELFRPTIIATPFQTLRALPQLRALTFASLGFAAVQGSVFSFFTTYMTDGLGLGLVFAGALFATMQIASFAGRLSAGVLADYVGAFRPVLIAMSLAAAGSCLLMAIVDASWPLPVMFAVAALTGLAAATWNGLFLAEIARVVAPGEVGSATAGTTFFTFIAYMFTPPAFALIVYFSSYQAAFLLVACAALSAFGFLVFGHRQSIEHSG